jgi:hypothetical protein
MTGEGKGGQGGGPRADRYEQRQTDTYEERHKDKQAGRIDRQRRGGEGRWTRRRGRQNGGKMNK